MLQSRLLLGRRRVVCCLRYIAIRLVAVIHMSVNDLLRSHFGVHQNVAMLIYENSIGTNYDLRKIAKLTNIRSTNLLIVQIFEMCKRRTQFLEIT